MRLWVRYTKICAVVSAVLLVSAVVFLTLVFLLNPVSTRSVENQYKKEIAAALPLGATRESVESWIRSKEMDPRYVYSGEDERIFAVSCFVDRRSGLYTYTVYLYFYLDEHDKLTKYDVDVRSTLP
jgi:hypothetical protein